MVRKYYSLYEEGENNANYWVKYGYWDQSTTPVVYTSDSDGYYFCVNETKAIAYVGISFDLSDGTATAISISPYDGSKKMDISGVPSAPKIVGYGSSVGSWTTPASSSSPTAAAAGCTASPLPPPPRSCSSSVPRATSMPR